MMSLRDFIQREWNELRARATAPFAQAPEPAAREPELIERAAEGARARQFLENDLFISFMAKAEAALTSELLNLPLDDDAGRRSLAVAIQTQRQWRKYLLALAEDERAAVNELERLKKPARYF